MADIELNGTIKLTADTTEVKKEVEKVEGGKSGGKSVAGTAEKGAKEAEDAAKVMGKRINDTINTVFGNVGRTATGTFTKVSSLFGNIGGLLGQGGTTATGAATAATAGGTGAAGTGAGGLAGAGAALPALGPVGIGVAAVAALGAVSLGVVAAFKALTEKIIDFGRTLSTVSPSMAVTFAQFDREMMLIKQKMGEMLAPALTKLLDSVISLVDYMAPYVVFFVDTISKIITAIINFEVAVGKAEEALMKFYMAMINKMGGVGLLGKVAGMVLGGAGGPVGQAADYVAKHGPLGEMADDFKKFLDEWRRNEAKKASGMVITDFMNRINADGSAQRQYQDEFRQQGPGSAYHAPIPIPRHP